MVKHIYINVFGGVIQRNFLIYICTSIYLVTFCAHHLVGYLLFSIIEFTFSVIPAYFVGVGGGNDRQFRGVCYHSRFDF